MARTAPAPIAGGEPQREADARERAAGQADTVTPRGRGDRARNVLRLVLLALAMAALGYGGGRLHAWTGERAAEREREAALLEQREAQASAEEEQRQRLASAQALHERTERERDQLALVTGLYEGYRRVQHALNALDARNFGIAEARVRDAERLLAPLAEQVAGLPDILAQLARTNVAVAGNLGEQRRALATIAASLDGALTEQRTVANIEELQAAARQGDTAIPSEKAAAPADEDAAEARTAPEPIVPAAPQPADQQPSPDAPSEQAESAGSRR